MPLNSRAKGAYGEREAAQALMDLGFAARRTVQYNGRSGDADLATSIEGVHFEVKFTERLSPYSFRDQATRDARGAIPVVLMRSNRKPWLVCVELSQLLPMCHAIVRAQSAILAQDRQAAPAEGRVMDESAQ